MLSQRIVGLLMRMSTVRLMTEASDFTQLFSDYIGLYWPWLNCVRRACEGMGNSDALGRFREIRTQRHWDFPGIQTTTARRSGPQAMRSTT